MIAFSLIANLNPYLILFPFVVIFAVPPLQFLKLFMYLSLCKSAFAFLYLPLYVYIFPCIFTSSLARLHLLLHIYLLLYIRISPLTYLSWLNIIAQLSLNYLANYLWANIITKLCLQSTLGETSLHDFACDLPLCKYYYRTLIAIHPWVNIIAELCPWSTHGQPIIIQFAPSQSAIYSSIPSLWTLFFYPEHFFLRSR